MATKTKSDIEFSEIDLMSEIQGSLLKLATDKKNKDASVNREAESDIQYPTGFLPLDYKNGHRVKVNLSNGSVGEYDSIGILDGTLDMFIGRSGCGKSTITYQIGGNIIRPFANGLMFIDLLEGGMLEERGCQLTGFNKDEFHSRVKIRNAGISIESVYSRIKAIHDVKVENEDRFRYDTGIIDSRGRPVTKFVPTVYIIDSIPLLMSAKISEEEQLSGQMSTTATAKQLAMLFRRINQLIKEANIIVLAVNHITQKIEINSFKHTKAQTAYLKPDETLPGGVTPLYLSNMVFRLDDGDKLTSDKEFGVDGAHVIVSNVKSRAGVSGLSSAVDLVLNYSIGFDPDLSLYMMLKNADKVNGAGAYMYFGERDDKKFSQKQFKKKLIEDPEFLEIFINECYNHLYAELSYMEEITKTANSATTNSIMDRICKMNVVTIPATVA